MSETIERKVAKGRYFKKASFFLDGGDGYTNAYEVFDGDIKTGIDIVARGPNSFSDRDSTVTKHTQTITYRGEQFPSLREAIFAYEDAKARGES